MRILAVDDDELILELLKGVLAQGGFTDITTADSAESALEIVAAATVDFDCFLLDIQMPGKNGIELCGMLTAMPQYKKTPKIMITAVAQREYVDRAFAAGAIDYINKPIDGLEVCTRVRLAEKFVREQRASAKNIFAVNALKAQVEDSRRIRFEDPVEVEDVPGVVSQLALENYLLQLSRGRAFRSAVIAFKIAEFPTIYSNASPSELYYTIADVAESIAEALKQSNFMLSNYGRGVFVAIVDRDAPVLSQELDIVIQAKIDEMEMAYDNGQPCKATIIVGKPATASLLSLSGTDSLILQAIASVDEEPAKRDEGTDTSFSPVKFVRQWLLAS